MIDPISLIHTVTSLNPINVVAGGIAAILLVTSMGLFAARAWRAALTVLAVSLIPILIVVITPRVHTVNEMADNPLTLIEDTYRVGDLTCTPEASTGADGVHDCVWVDRSGHRIHGLLTISNHQARLYAQNTLTEQEPVQ